MIFHRFQDDVDNKPVAMGWLDTERFPYCQGNGIHKTTIAQEGATQGKQREKWQGKEKQTGGITMAGTAPMGIHGTGIDTNRATGKYRAALRHTLQGTRYKSSRLYRDSYGSADRTESKAGSRTETDTDNQTEDDRTAGRKDRETEERRIKTSRITSKRQHTTDSRQQKADNRQKTTEQPSMMCTLLHVPRTARQVVKCTIIWQINGSIWQIDGYKWQVIKWRFLQGSRLTIRVQECVITPVEPCKMSCIQSVSSQRSSTMS